MDLPNSSSDQEILRPPPLSTLTSSSASQTPPLPPHSASPDPPTSFSPSSPSQPQSVPCLSNNVVVVGFIGRRPNNSIQLINRIIHHNVFGSGKLDTKLVVAKEEVEQWFKRRRISYYHEEERGILFLQFSTHRGSVFEAKTDYDSEIQEHEFGDLQGMLFMFSEGSWFDTNVLKKLRTLQSAKYALVKSRPKPPLPSRLRSSSASYSSLFPGRCTPVILFIFIDDFSDGLISNFSKKLQSSLEAQIRFLIKNFWRLNGSRGGRASSYASLFSLDALKAVVLVDRIANRTAESLEFAISLMEDVSDSLVLESHGESASEEDLVSLKEFISRQADILRGGAFTTHDELPSMEIWLSSSQRILQGILSAKCGCIDKLETRKRKPRPWYVPSVSIERNALGIAVSRFSTSWCERVLPGAKEVYLRDLPACYFKSQHEAHMEKAVLALHSMVKGPAVQHFAERLKEECKSIWMSGRQLCDAVSLTGKPCLHQRHSSEDHSSGYVFRHACGCGRSRRLRTDPFDFESANVTFNRFAGCDNFLAVVQLPGVSIRGHIQLSSWTLIRFGGAKYYEASKGLLQSGFYPTQRFLSKWKISAQMREGPIDFSMNALVGTVSIGFEHECPHGHRFLLNPDHLKELGSSYAACNVADSLKYGKRGRHGKARDSVNAANATVPSKSNCIRRMTANGIEDNGCGLFMLNRDLPIFMNCPHCKLSKNGKDPPNVKICGTISQLQRIFMVTPPFPIVLGTHPVIHFEELGLPPAVPERQQKLQFTFGCQVVLLPDTQASICLWCAT